MQIHAIAFDDFSSEDYHLISIHTTLEDYRIAYLLNLYLKLDFKKAKFSLDFKNQKHDASYSVYEFLDVNTDNYWFLISNVDTVEINVGHSDSLFDETKATVHLIPEKKKVDYFLKMEGNYELSYIRNIIDQINKMPQIITSYLQETNNLKSKEFLIF